MQKNNNKFTEMFILSPFLMYLILQGRKIKLGLREIHSINSRICFTILKVHCIFTINRVHCIFIAASKICQTKSTDPT